jgi:acetyltransferase
MSIRNLEALFQPASVALVGASDRAGSIGAVVLDNLRRGGFKGPIWPVNPRHKEIAGLPAWPDIASLPGTPDLAVICTPPQTVPALISQLGHKGTRAAIVMTAGLRDGAGEGVATLQQQMLDAARPHLLRVLGPNCIGLLLPHLGLNASFAPGNALPGDIAFVTQSGALATAMLDWANGRGIGFSHFISMGDSADVDFGDVLDYLASDASTRAILMYVESITHARKFMSAGRAAARNKPVILVKAGRAPDGARAAASHTGALAGSDLVFDAAARRAGMLRVDTLEDLFDAAQTLSGARRLGGERLAIVTNGGGAGVLAADALALAAGTPAELAPDTLAALDACLPATWSHGNPVDIIGDAPVARYQDALRVLLAATEVDAVLFMHAPTALVPAGEIAAACLPVVKASTKPVLTSWLGGPSVAQARAACQEAGVPGYATPERAVAAWMQRVHYARNQRTLQELGRGSLESFTPARQRAQEILAAAQRERHEWLDTAQARELLAAYGIDMVRTLRARDAAEAVRCAADLGYPVALKVMSQQVVHKSDVGGVALGLANGEEVRTAAVRMLQSVARLQPGASVSGFTVQEMAKRPGARELIVGIATDDVFGPVLLLGAGGTEVELHKEHAAALPPLNATLARELIARSGLAPQLAGHRGRPPAHEGALVETLMRVSQLACDLEGVAELDINPLVIDSRGVLALDARVRLWPRSRGARPPTAIRPYPDGLEQEVTVAATQLLLRPIRPQDGTLLEDFYAKASPADMRLRFFMARRDVPHSELARYSQIDYDREMAFVALTPPGMDGRRAIAGEVRAACDPDNLRAEFAIQVASGWQGKGLGRILMDKLLAFLRARGTAQVTGQCLADNTGMAALARQAGFDVQPEAGGDTMSMRLNLTKEAP